MDSSSTKKDSIVYSANDIANYFVLKGIKDRKPVTQMKVQKLVYIAHGWHLGITCQPLISSDIQAWKFGPVIEDLYHILKWYGNNSITEPITSSSKKLDENLLVKEFLDTIWETYGKYDAMFLSDLTHQDGTPWDDVAKKSNYRLPKGEVINEDLIREYYQNMSQKKVEA